MFWNHQKILNEEEIKKIIEEQKKKLADLEFEFERMKSHMTSLRGLVNRKLEYPKEIKEMQETETENNIKPSVFLSPNGLPI
jgi:tRNA C32,U32 (ribose-2'-O)-methylase TrmJ